MILDNKNKELLNLIQNNFPLKERPFQEIGNNLGLSEDNVITRLKQLTKEQYIKFIGAIINTSALGYQSLLVAFQIEPEKIDKAVEIINSHPGVSHNYQRNNSYNLWFTIAVPKDIDINKTVEIIFRLSKAQKYLLLPSLKVYKIRFILDIFNKNNISNTNKIYSHNQNSLNEILPLEKKVLEQIQNTLPITPEPFHYLASNVNISVSEFLSIMNDLLSKNVIRRFGTILSHKKIGYQYNVLALWEISEQKIDEYGHKIAFIKNVSHCYQRRTYPDWPYSLYSMIHCQSEAECNLIINTILKETETKNYKLLLSVKEHKKKRLKYFTEEFNEWQKKYHLI